MKIGSYHIINKIGSGGNGVVFKASHPTTGRLVALKILNRDGDVRRIKNEVRLHASLRHNSIATLLDLIIHDGKQVLVMDYVDGLNLDEYLLQNDLTLKQKKNLFLKILEPVEYLHNRQIIHRDLKPENIKVLKSGEVKLLDFGISLGLSSPKLTKAGHIVGTIHYSAPERLKGINKKQSDIWSLGAIYYEMITGDRLVNKSNTSLTIDMLKNERDVFLRIDEIEEPEKQILKKCLRKNMAARYRTVADLRKDVLKPIKAPKPHSSIKILVISKKWLILPLLISVFISVIVLIDYLNEDKVKGPAHIEFLFYPEEAQLKLYSGQKIKSGETINGEYGERYEGYLSAPGYIGKNIIISFSNTKDYDTITESLKKQ